MKSKILAKVSSVEEITLKELYVAFPEIKDYTVRGELNQLVKSGSIIRVERGKYKRK